MKKTKYSFLLGFSLLSLALLSSADEPKTKSIQPTIDLSKYNTISKSIDSLNNLVEKNEQDLRVTRNEIEKQKAKKIKLIAECDSVKKDTSIIYTDFLPKLLSKCDTLSQLLKKIDTEIKEDSDKISKCKQSIIAHQEKISIQKGQLQNESKSIVAAAKKCNGSIHFIFKGADYNVLIANADSNEIKMHWQNKDKRNYVSIRNLLHYLEEQKTSPIMITNAGMYTPALQPQGLYIEQFGKELRSLDLKVPKTDANFYLKPNGVYFIDTFGISHIETTEDFQKVYEAKKVAIEYATQSGPMLLINGAIHQSFTENSYNKKIRSGVGIIDEKHTVFAISLDEVNFYDFALLFKNVFGCKDALFLDGAISQMYLHDLAPNEQGGQFGAMISVAPKTFHIDTTKQENK